MKSTSQKIQEINLHGFHIDSGTILNQSFENYKKIFITVGTLMLVLVTLFTILGGIATFISIFSFGVSNITELVTRIHIDDYPSIEIILKFLGATIGSALLAPLKAGVLKIAHAAHNKSAFSFSDAFSFYRSNYFKALFISAIIISVLVDGLNALLDLFLEYNKIGLLNGVVNLFIGMLNALATLLTIFTIPLIIFGNLPAKEAIKGSITVVLKKFWPLLGLGFISLFCSIAFGIMAFCVGVCYTLPFLFSLQYTLYRNVIGIENKEESV